MFWGNFISSRCHPRAGCCDCNDPSGWAHHVAPTVVAGTSPLLLTLQQNVEAPYLDPNDKEGFPKFAQLWGEWAKWQLCGAPGGPLGDMMQRDLLLTRLRPTLRDRFREEITKRPAMAFQEVWDDLAASFNVDNPHFWKQRWEDVKLVKVDGKITWSNWKLYQSKFEATLSKVSQWTDLEVVDAIMKQLPHGWVEKILQREGKDAKHRWMLRLSHVACDVNIMREILARAVGPLKGIETQRDGFVVEFMEERQMLSSLAMGDYVVGGQRVAMMPMRAL